MKNSVPTGNRAAAFSVLEIVLAVSLLSVCMLVLGNILLSSTDTVDHMMVDTTADQEITRGLNRFTADVATSSAAVLTVDTSGSQYDRVTLQTPGPYTGAANWGAVDADGVWRSDWSVTYEVTGDNLVRRVLDTAGNPSGADALLVRQVDRLAGGVKGFRVVRNGPLINITIRTRKNFRNNSEYTKEYSSTVFLKNS